MTVSAAAPARPTIRQRFRDTIADVLSRPLVDYFFIVSAVVLLTSIGLLTVTSATMSASATDTWSAAAKQSIFVAMGFIGFWVALQVPLQWVRNLSTPLLWVSIALLFVTLIRGVGAEEVGSQSWLQQGFIGLQPSELAKVAICIWGAKFFADTTGPGKNPAMPYFKFASMAALCCVLIFFQGDVGMVMMFGITVTLVLTIAGVDPRMILGIVGIGTVGVFALAVGGGFRSDRFIVFWETFQGDFADIRNRGYQSYQGLLSLAEGSVTGVGLGQSRAKWNYLPEAKNDFVFAIVGEEQGLIGAVFVIALYLLLLAFGLRCAMRHDDRFQALLAAGLTVGVVVQAAYNIAYVIGLAPITGIQLPMISSGGTSAVVTLTSMGLLASCARHEPEAVAGIQTHGLPVGDRLLKIRPPQHLRLSRYGGATLTAAPRAAAPRNGANSAPRSTSAAGGWRSYLGFSQPHQTRREQPLLGSQTRKQPPTPGRQASSAGGAPRKGAAASPPRNRASSRGTGKAAPYRSSAVSTTRNDRVDGSRPSYPVRRYPTVQQSDNPRPAAGGAQLGSKSAREESAILGHDSDTHAGSQRGQSNRIRPVPPVRRTPPSTGSRSAGPRVTRRNRDR
ncbi:putative peptidoglycan glycosyltransferase FtsW [Corynebacterium choanae]|nr:putative peptidoglycan glycosyltransferase FtsW [Corynebacterium choanae]